MNLLRSKIPNWRMYVFFRWNTQRYVCDYNVANTNPTRAYEAVWLDKWNYRLEKIQHHRGDIFAWISGTFSWDSMIWTVLIVDIRLTFTTPCVINGTRETSRQRQKKLSRIGTTSQIMIDQTRTFETTDVLIRIRLETNTMTISWSLERCSIVKRISSHDERVIRTKSESELKDIPQLFLHVNEVNTS